jgi:hypothetical protein
MQGMEVSMAGKTEREREREREKRERVCDAISKHVHVEMTLSQVQLHSKKHSKPRGKEKHVPTSRYKSGEN